MTSQLSRPRDKDDRCRHLGFTQEISHLLRQGAVASLEGGRERGLTNRFQPLSGIRASLLSGQPYGDCSALYLRHAISGQC